MSNVKRSNSSRTQNMFALNDISSLTKKEEKGSTPPAEDTKQEEKQEPKQKTKNEKVEEKKNENKEQEKKPSTTSNPTPKKDSVPKPKTEETPAAPSKPYISPLDQLAVEKKKNGGNVSIYFDKETLQFIDETTKQLDTTRSKLVNAIVKQYMETVKESQKGGN